MKKVPVQVKLERLVSDGRWAVRDDLLQSIRQHGMIYPLVVVEDGDGRLLIKDGRHRYACLVRLGYQYADVILVVPEEGDTDAEGQLYLMPAYALALTMNLHADNPLSDARAIEDALNDGHSEAWLKEQFGLTVRQIRRKLSLLNLPVEVQRALEHDDVSVSACYALARLPHDDAAHVWREALQKAGKTQDGAQKRPSVRLIKNLVRDQRIADQPVIPLPVPEAPEMTDAIDWSVIAERMAAQAADAALAEDEQAVVQEAAEIVRYW